MHWQTKTAMSPRLWFGWYRCLEVSQGFDIMSRRICSETIPVFGLDDRTRHHTIVGHSHQETGRQYAGLQLIHRRTHTLDLRGFDEPRQLVGNISAQRTTRNGSASPCRRCEMCITRPCEYWDTGFRDQTPDHYPCYHSARDTHCPSLL